MAKARLSTAVVARACGDNALAHIGVDPRSL
jgi:hypothetical protein